MTSLAPVLQQALLPVGSIMGVGLVWRRVRPGGVDAATARRVIGALVMYVFYPALAFHTVTRAQVNAELILAPALTMFAIVLGMGLAFGLFRLPLFRLTGPAQLGALVIACGLPNIISLGIPVLQALFGPDGARYAVYADILGINPLFWSLALWVSVRCGSHGEQLDTPWQFLRVLTKLPPIWAFLIGFVLNVTGVAVPAGIDKAAGMLGYATMPAMLLTVGMSLSFGHFLRFRRHVIGVSLIKLVLVPAAVYALAHPLAGSGELTVATTLLMGMPTMMASMILSERFGLDTELLAAVMVGSTLLYFVTLPLGMALLL
ncbi:MAG TPA: AEC family transporter [Gammaproteobacteria bacterium]|uniref:AEC family transporter n=1 Tax=Immundisolibacter sp. TaxID=1934948 RepID=UPI000E86609A|nr:AEC family transporter [Gammaproteobacteria bacterium]HCZ47631.1 AEC family transporter [Gammaproteobacteria bacterium]MCH77069.1 AEC family transporter [Gammaproteobacteria bacterium]